MIRIKQYHANDANMRIIVKLLNC